MLTKHVQIPSKGLYYPEGHPLHNCQTVEIKLLTAKEEDILTDQSLAKSGQTIKVLIDSILIDKAIKQGTLLAGDRSAILIKARQLSLGANYKFTWHCNRCGKNNTDQADLGNFKFKGQPQRLGQPTFEAVLPVTGKMVKYRLFTGRDEDAIRKIQQNRKKAKMSPAMVTTRLTQAIISIDGDQDIGAISQFVEQMPARDAKHLRDQLQKNTPDLDVTVALTCANCQAQKEVMLPITAAFFRVSD